MRLALIFRCSPGRCVSASILPAAALLDSLLWFCPLSPAGWQTWSTTEAASVWRRQTAVFPGTRSAKMRGCQAASASASMLARREGKRPLASSGVLGSADLGGISQLSGPRLCVSPLNKGCDNLDPLLCTHDSFMGNPVTAALCVQGGR